MRLRTRTLRPELVYAAAVVRCRCIVAVLSLVVLACSEKASHGEGMASAVPQAHSGAEREVQSATVVQSSAPDTKQTQRVVLDGVTVDAPASLSPLPETMIDSLIAAAREEGDKDSTIVAAGVGPTKDRSGPLVMLMRTVEPRPLLTAVTVRQVIEASIDLSKERIGDQLKPQKDEVKWLDDTGEWCTTRSDGTRTVMACSRCWVPNAKSVMCVGAMCAMDATRAESVCAPVIASRVTRPSDRLPLDKKLPVVPAVQ